jgi:hypothetical protein
VNLKLVMILAYTIVLPAFIGIINLIYKSPSKTISILSWLFIVSLIAELLSTAIEMIFHNNMIIASITFFAEGWFVLHFVNSILERPLALLFPVAPIFFTFVGLVELVVSGATFLNLSYTLKNIAVISGLFLVCFQVASGRNITEWLYYVVGVFLFYFITSSVYSLVASPSMNGELLFFITDIHIIINALCNLFFGLALWKLSFTKQSLLLS